MPVQSFCENVLKAYSEDLNMPTVLNMPGLEIWKGCEYARETQGSEYD